MTRRMPHAVVLAGTAALTGCANGGGSVSPFALDQSVAVSYGTVEVVSPVAVSPTGEIAGGVVGGLLGLALTAGHSGGSELLGVAGGALAGGLLGHALQGSDTADQFLIRRADGSTVQVTTEQRNLAVGECVAIEQGEHTNLRPVSPVYCQGGSGVVAASRVALEAQHDAQVCHDAKQDLLLARGDQAITAGAARVQALCHG